MKQRNGNNYESDSESSDFDGVFDDDKDAKKKNDQEELRLASKPVANSTCKS